MGLEKEIDAIFELTMDLEKRQKDGESATQHEVDNLKSLTLTLESIAESMLPEEDGNNSSS